MNVKGIGVDLALIPRLREVVERWDERFLRRVFTDEEIAYCRRRRDPIPHFAARFAAKEATLKVRRGRPGIVLGAPHGTSDKGTDIIARDLAGLTGFSLVVATGFSHLGADGRRLNVNRPTESVPGTPARLEAESEDARRVYEAYRRHVAEAAQGPLRLYVEVHGNAHKESAGRLEIATVGLSREDAWRLKTLFELIRD